MRQKKFKVGDLVCHKHCIPNESTELGIITSFDKRRKLFVVTWVKHDGMAKPCVTYTMEEMVFPRDVSYGAESIYYVLRHL